MAKWHRGVATTRGDGNENRLKKASKITGLVHAGVVKVQADVRDQQRRDGPASVQVRTGMRGDRGIDRRAFVQVAVEYSRTV